MTAPVAAFVQLPVDTANTGKKRRTQTRVVGADTVHEDFIVLARQRHYYGGNYKISSYKAIPAAAQDPTTDAMMVAYPSAARHMAIHRISLDIQFTDTSAVDNKPGNLIFQKGSKTGSATAPTAGLSFDSTTSSVVVGTVPGTLVLGTPKTLLQWHLPINPVVNPVGVFNPYTLVWEAKEEEDQIIIYATEALAIYNAVAVDTANRHMIIRIEYKEFD